MPPPTPQAASHKQAGSRWDASAARLAREEEGEKEDAHGPLLPEGAPEAPPAEWDAVGEGGLTAQVKEAAAEVAAAAAADLSPPDTPAAPAVEPPVLGGSPGGGPDDRLLGGSPGSSSYHSVRSIV